jgi:hypothetical protein
MDSGYVPERIDFFCNFVGISCRHRTISYWVFPVTDFSSAEKNQRVKSRKLQAGKSMHLYLRFSEAIKSPNLEPGKGPVNIPFAVKNGRT